MGNSNRLTSLLKKGWATDLAAFESDLETVQRAVGPAATEGRPGSQGTDGGEGIDPKLAADPGGGISTADDGAADTGLLQGCEEQPPEILGERAAERFVSLDEIGVCRAESGVEDETAALSGDGDRPLQSVIESAAGDGDGVEGDVAVAPLVCLADRCGGLGRTTAGENGQEICRGGSRR